MQRSYIKIILLITFIFTICTPISATAADLSPKGITNGITGISNYVSNIVKSVANLKNIAGNIENKIDNLWSNFWNTATAKMSELPADLSSSLSALSHLANIAKTNTVWGANFIKNETAKIPHSPKAALNASLNTITKLTHNGKIPLNPQNFGFSHLIDSDAIDSSKLESLKSTLVAPLQKSLPEINKCGLKNSTAMQNEHCKKNISKLIYGKVNLNNINSMMKIRVKQHVDPNDPNSPEMSQLEIWRHSMTHDISSNLSAWMPWSILKHFAKMFQMFGQMFLHFITTLENILTTIMSIADDLHTLVTLVAGQMEKSAHDFKDVQVPGMP